MRGTEAATHLVRNFREHGDEFAKVSDIEDWVENLALLLVLCAVGRQKPRPNSQITRATTGISKTAAAFNSKGLATRTRLPNYPSSSCLGP